MINKAIIIAVIFILTGCTSLRMGENVLFISGDLVNHKSEECSIHLLYESENTASSFNIRQITGKFTEDFVIAPNNATYTAKVVCDGKVVLQQTASYPSKAELFNLGVIQ